MILPSITDETRWRRALLAIVVGGSLVHVAYVAFGPLALAPDEAHYWEWSRRLDWSYYSKGPMVAWLIAASTAVFGSTELGVRMPAIVLGAGTALVAARLALDLFASWRAAFFAVLLLAAMPLYAAGSMLMTIDPPFVFGWAVATWALVRATRAPAGATGRWWALCGAAVGFGMLAKYTMALFVPVAALAALGVEARRRESVPHAAVALTIAALFSPPILWWNAHHDWVSVRHVLGQIGLSSQEPRRGSIRGALELVASQLGVVSPGILVAMAVAARRADRVLLATSLPVLAFFVVWSFHDKVEANWPAPAWFALAVALAGEWHRRFDRWGARAIAAALAPGVLLVALAHVAPALALPPRLDPTRRLRGWRELGAEVARASGGALPIAAASYQMASELAFYVPAQPRVFNLDLGGRRRNQYDLWGGNEALVARDVVVVIEGEVDPASLAPLCERPRRFAVARGRDASILLCGAARSSVAQTLATRY